MVYYHYIMGLFEYIFIRPTPLAVNCELSYIFTFNLNMYICPCFNTLELSMVA